MEDSRDVLAHAGGDMGEAWGLLIDELARSYRRVRDGAAQA
jgi:hypothetical protein